MRIRTIKPEFWASDDIAALPWEVRLLFIGLWSYVDDNGVGRDNPKLIVADLFPLEEDPRDTLATVSRGLLSLFSAGLIDRYEVDGKPYLHITTWKNHQRIDRPNKERYPLPTREDANPRDTLATVSRDSGDTLAPGTEEQGNKGTEEQGNRRPPTGDVRALRARRAIVDGWRPSDETAASIKTEYPHLDITAEHLVFIDYWRGTGKPMKDWEAVWRNWMRRAAREHGPTNGQARSRSQEHLDANRAAWDAWAAEEELNDRKAIAQ